jgi:glutamate racemase
VTERLAIGIFDSGVGGLTVVRAVREALPEEHIIYLGDTARVPYGSKSPRTVERYSLACLRFLLARGVRLVMIACNTASANALPALREASPVPVIGAVEPGARSALAATRGHRLGVIGTLSTVASGAYEAAIRSLAPDAHITALACPLLVPLAEEGWTDGEIAVQVARRYLSELFEMDPAIDTLVLGCTHYPLLRETIRAVAAEISGHPVGVVDSAAAMALAATELIAANTSSGDMAPGLDCYATDTSRLDVLAPRFLGQALTSFELVDL